MKERDLEKKETRVYEKVMALVEDWINLPAIDGKRAENLGKKLRYGLAGISAMARMQSNRRIKDSQKLQDAYLVNGQEGVAYIKLYEGKMGNYA